MKSRSFNCATCGKPTQAYAIHTRAKYCPSCRFVNQLIWGRRRRRECIICDQEFAPLDSSDTICGNCLPEYTHESTDYPECAICHRHRKPVNPETKACLPCVHNPSKRIVLLKAALKKQQEEINEHGPN